MLRLIGVVIVTLMISSSAVALTAQEEAQLFAALYKVESNCGQNMVGDQGKAIGPYQIWFEYWKDATEFDSSIGGSYQDCYKKEYAEKVIRAYWRRYASAKRLSREASMEDLARIHNGGPNGYRSTKTIKYWARVKACLSEKG